jgi:hypothetical protein
MEEVALDVVIRVPADQVDGVLDVLKDESEPVVLPSAGAAGGGDLIAILITATAGAIPFIAKAIVELGKLRRASIEIEGIKASGISIGTAEELLKEHLRRKEKRTGSRKG